MTFRAWFGNVFYNFIGCSVVINMDRVVFKGGLFSQEFVTSCLRASLMRGELSWGELSIMGFYCDGLRPWSWTKHHYIVHDDGRRQLSGWDGKLS